MKSQARILNKTSFLFVVIGCIFLNGCNIQNALSIPSNEPLYQFGWGVIYDVAWHHQGGRIAIATPVGIRFHHPDTLKEIDFWATASPVMALIYRKDGMLISGEQSGRITIWNNQGQLAYILSGSNTPCYLTISPDERWLSVSDCMQKRIGQRQKVEVWNLPEQDLSGVFQTQRHGLRGTVFNPQSNEITIFETGEGYCRWRLIDGQQVECHEPFCDGLPCGPKQVIASRESSRLAYLQVYGTVYDRSWGEEKKRKLFVSACDNCGGYDIEYSPHISKLTVGITNEILVFDVDSGEVTTRILDMVARHFAFSPDEERFVAVTNFGTLTLFETLTGKQLAAIDNYWGEVNAIVISPDQSQLAVGYGSGTINVWDLRTARLELRLNTRGSVTQLAYIQNGQQLAYLNKPRHWYEYGFEKDMVGVFSISNGQLIDTEVNTSEIVWSEMRSQAITYLESKDWIVVGENGIIKIWDAQIHH